MITLSFIIPTFLRSEKLKEKIKESIYLKDKNVEFVFVIEREDINSFELLNENKEKNIKIVFNNGPHYHSFHRGAEFSSGKYLCFMGDDDFLLKNNFLKILEKIKNSDAEWLIGGGMYINNKRQFIRKNITNIKFWLLKKFNKVTLTFINFIMTPSVIIKRDVFFECGGFDKRFKYAQDYYCWLNVSKKYKPIIINEFITTATFDETTFSGSFDFKRYIDYFFQIKKYQSNLFINLLQFLSTLYIVFHNFIFKKIIRPIISIIFLKNSKHGNIKYVKNTKDEILHITRKFDIKNLGGIEEGIIQLTNYDSSKFNYTLYACGASEKKFIYKKIKVHIFKTNFIFFNNQFSLNLLIELYKKKNFFKFFHIHSPWPTIEMLFILFKNSVICTYHADAIRNKYLTFIYYFFYKKFINRKNVKLINISTEKYYLNSQLKKIIADPNKIFFQGMGVQDLVDMEIRMDLINPEIINFYNNNKKVVLFFGRNRHYKGIETINYLLEKNENINYLISSSNKTLNYSQKNNVLLVDKLNFDEKIFVLKNSYLHLFPSSNRAESLGIALIECQMFGLPSLIYELESGTSVIIQNDINGLIVKKNNKVEYFDKLKSIIDNEKNRDFLSKNARNNYLKNFNLNNFKKYYEKLNLLDV